jgi:hypothetical protein
MERGLLWLPLLAFFIGLAWIGWREFQQVEAYQTWAKQFDRAKYDIYAVLGQKDDQLTWGKPTRKGPIDLESFSMQSIESVHLRVNGQLADLENPPAKGRAELELTCRDRDSPRSIPFTEPDLAAKWGQYLIKQLEPGKG